MFFGPNVNWPCVFGCVFLEPTTNLGGTSPPNPPTQLRRVRFGHCVSCVSLRAHTACCVTHVVLDVCVWCVTCVWHTPKKFTCLKVCGEGRFKDPLSIPHPTCCKLEALPTLRNPYCISLWVNAKTNWGSTIQLHGKDLAIGHEDKRESNISVSVWARPHACERVVWVSRWIRTGFSDFELHCVFAQTIIYYL